MQSVGAGPVPSGRWALMLLAVWVSVGTSACRRWVTIAESPIRGLGERERGEGLLVMLRSCERLRLLPSVDVTGDNLGGRSRRPSDGPPSGHVVLALRDIEEIRVSRADEVATSLLVAGAVVGVFVGGS